MLKSIVDCKKRMLNVEKECWKKIVGCWRTNVGYWKRMLSAETRMMNV